MRRSRMGRQPLHWLLVRAAVKRQRGLTFDDGHERVIKPDGTASTRCVMKLKLIETS
jgi:hypothetical protein